MQLSEKFTAAFELAWRLHRNQRRRGTEVPYAAHLLGVCGLVLNEGGTEDQAIAALLHDSVEDHPDEISFEQVEQQFGKSVRIIVEASTEPPPPPQGRDPGSWLDQKMRYVEHIRQAPEAAKLVILADKLDNARLLELAANRWGDDYWIRFKSPTREEMTRYHEALRESLKGWNSTELYRQFIDLMKKLSTL